ncbi:hypothetical protein JTB14_017157 [Gonioctena quinquepunctata]|nr:hypothetical protein JTB14_017157 [Gonioctena quinquepunctata]
MTTHRLQIAPKKKTKAVILKGQRGLSIQFNMQGAAEEHKKTAKNLGVMLGYRLNFEKHIEFIRNKMEYKISDLPRMLPNIRGSPSRRRNIITGIIGGTCMD